MTYQIGFISDIAVFVLKKDVKLQLTHSPDWVKSSIKMFADDTKLWSTIRSASDTKISHDNLNSLNNWSDKWLLNY